MNTALVIGRDNLSPRSDIAIPILSCPQKSDNCSQNAKD
jgi:hypothetical protein